MKNKQLKNILFAAVAFIFTALCLYGYLVNSIKLQQESKALNDIRSENSKLEEEIEQLKIEYDNSLSLTELEEYARDVLGLRRCRPEQIVYITIDED